MYKFVEWLLQELETRGLKQADIARNGNITTAAVSKMINNFTVPGTDMCLAIAKTLNISPEEVYRRAGLLPGNTERTILEERADYILSQLSQEDQQDILEYMEFRLQKSQREKKDTGTLLPTSNPR